MYESKFSIGDFVYSVTDVEQRKRQIVAIKIYPTGVVYECYCGIQESNHYEFELSTEQDIVLKQSDL